jgi:phosphoglycerate dehydrogenase-like enzyme
MKALFTDFVFEDKGRIRLDGCTFTFHGPTSSVHELVELARDVDIICMRDRFVGASREVLDKLPKLRMIATRSTGYDHVNVRAASEKGIVVCNIPDYGSHMIAEHAFGLLVAVARNIVKGANRYAQDKLFNDKGLMGVELSGKTLGILGTGRIGTHAARIGHGFGMRTIAYDVVNISLLAGLSRSIFASVSSTNIFVASPLPPRKLSEQGTLAFSSIALCLVKSILSTFSMYPEGNSPTSTTIQFRGTILLFLYM